MKKPDPRQRSVFELLESPAIRLGAMSRAVKQALNQAASESNLSREEIVHRAGLLAAEAGVSLCKGGRLSLDTLNKWLDINAFAYMPTLNGLIFLCEILDNDIALSQYLAARGLEIMTAEDKKYCELGRANQQLKEARRKLKYIEETI